MKKCHENGRSMVEMIGVLSIIGVISAGGLMGYSKAMYKFQLSKTVSMVTEALQDYTIFLKRGVETSLMIQTPAQIKQYGLMSSCEPDSSNTACQMPLGRIYPNFETSDEVDALGYNYYLAISFEKAQKNACIDFLGYDWNQMVPDRWWRHGSEITVSSGHGDLALKGKGGQIVYSATLNKLNPAGATDICNAVCPEGTAECNVVFHFHGKRY